MKIRFLSAVMAILMLTSCGSRNDGWILETEEDKVSLMILAGQSTSDAGIEDMITDVLEEKYPYIQLEWECVDWGGKFADQMFAKFAAGDIPDIMIGKAQDVKTYQPTGNIAPISGAYVQYVEEASLPAVSIDGQIYGLSYNALYQGVLYNKDIFQALELFVPKTLDELEQIINKLNENDIMPFATHFADNWNIGNITMQFALNEVFQKYPNWGDMLREGKVSFAASDEYKKCFLYNQYIKENSWKDVLLIDQQEADSRFAKGEAAMYITGTWSLQTINEVNRNMNLGFFPFPNSEGNANLIFEPNMTFMKGAGSKYNKEIDLVLDAIFSDVDLATSIINFTQTTSLLEHVEATYPILVQDDIDQYVRNNKIIDVTVGNTQLVWTYQLGIAKQAYSWLRNDIQLDDVLRYADQNKKDS